MRESPSARAVVQQFIDRFKIGHDLAALDDLLAPAFVHHFELPGIAPDGAGFRQLATALLAAFPDVQVNVDIAQGRIAENWPAVNFERIMRQITAP